LRLQRVVGKESSAADIAGRFGSYPGELHRPIQQIYPFAGKDSSQERQDKTEEQRRSMPATDRSNVFPFFASTPKCRDKPLRVQEQLER
jgi:hypothetical protein